MTFDYAAISKRYNKPMDEVITKVDKYASEIKSELKDFYSGEELNTEVEKIVTSNLGRIFVLKGLEYAKDQYAKGNTRKANVIILGVSPSEDRNSYEKWKCTTEYWKDPKSAVEKGFVREAISKTGKTYSIPLVHDKTRKNRDGVEEPNPDFGKDIPEALKVNIPMIICGWTRILDGKEVVEPTEEFKMSSMPWDYELVNHPDVGKKSTVYGNINGQYFTVAKDAYEGHDVYNKAYDVAMRVLPTTEFWMDLPSVDSLPIQEDKDDGSGDKKAVYSKFACKGNVQRVNIMDMKSKSGNTYQKLYLRIGDVDLPNGINLSTTYTPVLSYVESNVTKDDDVIVFGCKKSYAKRDDKGEIELIDGKRVMLPKYELWGVVRSFDSAHDQMIQRLKEKGLV